MRVKLRCTTMELKKGSVWGESCSWEELQRERNDITCILKFPWYWRWTQMGFYRSKSLQLERKHFGPLSTGCPRTTSKPKISWQYPSFPKKRRPSPVLEVGDQLSVLSWQSFGLCLLPAWGCHHSCYSWAHCRPWGPSCRTRKQAAQWRQLEQTAIEYLTRVHSWCLIFFLLYESEGLSLLSGERDCGMWENTFQSSELSQNLWKVQWDVARAGRGPRWTRALTGTSAGRAENRSDSYLDYYARRKQEAVTIDTSYPYCSPSF